VHFVPRFTAARSSATGTAKVSKTLVSDFKHGLLYVNVHTAKNPNGEIPGQVQAAVPG
jgi:hypothetical protein